MCSSANRASDRPRSRILTAALVGLLVVAAAPCRAQEEPSAPQPIDGWEAVAEQAESLVNDPDTTTDTLELVREQLVEQRSAALDAQTMLEAEVRALEERLDALGPAPEDGMREPSELVERRTRLGEQLADARVPLAEAREASRRAESLIAEIDQTIRNRFAATLRERGPTPVNPVNWTAALADIGEGLNAQRAAVVTGFAPGERRAEFLRRLPLDILLVALGLQLRLSRWVERTLREGTGEHWIGGLLALRNLSRLILPAVGGGLALGAGRSIMLVGTQPGLPLFWLPDFALVVIWAGWLAPSLFAPQLRRFRPIAADDVAAAWGARLTLAFGTLLGLSLLAFPLGEAWDLSRETLAVLNLPVAVLAGIALWQAAWLAGSIRQGLAQAPSFPSGPGVGGGSDTTGALKDRLLFGLARVLVVLAVLIPAAAALGYFALSRFLLTATVLNLGLLGTAIVLYDLCNAVLSATVHRLSRRAEPEPQAGLAPVVVAGVLIVAAAPLVALIWGARVTDLQAAWLLLRDGVEAGGIRISLGLVLQFALVFGVVYGLARLLKAVLRTAVLPRTRMDAGARNAVLAGVGYTGFAVALIAAVVNTGVDLSSVAIVAGALSVGIGFGLQTIVSNFVSGIILLIERPIKEGDWIEVGGHIGYVRGISVRSTEIEMFDKASLIVPNQDLIAGMVLNRTHSTMSGRLRVPVPVARRSDPRQVEKILMAIAEEHPMVLADPEPKVLFMGFGDQSMNFEIFCYLRDVNYVLWTHSDLNFTIVERFRAAGIEIPFPQRELHLPADLSAALGTEDAGDGEAPIRRRSNA